MNDKEKAKLDLLLYGVSFTERLPDGTERYIPVRDVFIEANQLIPKQNESEPTYSSIESID